MNKNMPKKSSISHILIHTKFHHDFTNKHVSKPTNHFFR